MEIKPGLPHVETAPLISNLDAADSERDSGFKAVDSLIIQHFAGKCDGMLVCVIPPALILCDRMLKSVLLIPTSDTDLRHKFKVHAFQVVQIEAEFPEVVRVDRVIAVDLVPEIIILIIEVVVSPSVSVFTVFMPFSTNVEIRMPISLPGNGDGAARSIAVSDLDRVSVSHFRNAERILVKVPLISDVVEIIDHLIVIVTKRIPANFKRNVLNACADIQTLVNFQRPHFCIVCADPEFSGIITFRLMAFFVEDADTDSYVLVYLVPSIREILESQNCN